jgi:exodeoxyribonuclease III
MKICTYNLNGIRAAMSKDLVGWIKETNYDIYCFQETKAQPDQIDTKAFEELGYHHYWYSAQKKGYSGVGILTKVKPDNVVMGNKIEAHDFEGRMIRIDFGAISVASIYYPSGSSGEDRQGFKMIFLDEMYAYIEQLKKERPTLILCGDYNICHQPIDIHDPKGNKDSSGFLPEERAWMDKLFTEGKMVDAFREINTTPDQYTWWSYRFNARANNKGWRIDYIAVTENLKSTIRDAKILPDAKHSDHCPMVVEFDI